MAEPNNKTRSMAMLKMYFFICVKCKTSKYNNSTLPNLNPLHNLDE